MMQFYKKRDFGTLISDTFSFFRVYGKNYFKNYILINGLLLIVLAVTFIIGFKELFGQLFGSNTSGESFYFEQYFEDNLGVFAVTGIIIFLLFSVLIILNFLFPVFYIKRIAEGNLNIKADDILSDFKKNSKKIMILYFGLTFLVFPVSLVLFSISYLLILMLIGIVVMLFTVPSLFNVITFLTYDYFNSNRGFFESLSYALRAQFSYKNGREKSPYWKYWGSTLILFIIYYVVNLVFTMIPIIIFYVLLFTNTQDAKFEQNPFGEDFGIIIFSVYGVSILVSFFLMNLLYVNSGLIYYDSRTELHKELDMIEIESIGTHE